MDPCDQWESNGDTNLMANCAADVGAGFTQSELFVEVDYPGNQNLSPEKADTITFGAVFEPGMVDGLVLTVDYFQIDIGDSIRNRSPPAALEQCHFSAHKAHPAGDEL